MPTSPTEGTASLDKALDVLDAVGTAPAGLSQAELAERLALPRTTAYRLLGTLVARGLLRRDAQRKVNVLGLRCFEYARAAYAMPDLVAAAGAELRALRDMSGETACLATRDGPDVVSLDRCDGAHSQRSQSALGQRKPLHCTSQGKALLEALPGEQRDALVRELTLTTVTPHSITDRRQLLAELRVTAARGFSIDEEEILPGVHCCGAAIVDARGTVRGAISVAGPKFRLTRERTELLGPEVAQATPCWPAPKRPSRPCCPTRAVCGCSVAGTGGWCCPTARNSPCKACPCGKTVPATVCPPRCARVLRRARATPACGPACPMVTAGAWARWGPTAPLSGRLFVLRKGTQATGG